MSWPVLPRDQALHDALSSTPQLSTPPLGAIGCGSWQHVPTHGMHRMMRSTLLNVREPVLLGLSWTPAPEKPVLKSDNIILTLLGSHRSRQEAVFAALG